jgi:hypothetical protein
MAGWLPSAPCVQYTYIFWKTPSKEAKKEEKKKEDLALFYLWDGFLTFTVGDILSPKHNFFSEICLNSQFLISNMTYLKK